MSDAGVDDTGDPTVDVAVVPAAGRGTRMLPATKAIPKELLTIVDRPAIQRIVEEAAGAGIGHVVIVTSPAKPAVRTHFAPDPALERHLEAAGRAEELAEIRALQELAEVTFLEQAQPLGLGHAVNCAAAAVGDRSFAVPLPDQLQPEGPGLLSRMIDTHGSTGRSVVALRHVPRSEIHRYGCAAVAPDAMLLDGQRVTSIVEKPAPEDAPSELAVKSRYVFGPEIFSHLDGLAPGHGGEVQLTDAMAFLAEADRLVGVIDDGPSFDIGTPSGFVAAQAAYG